MVSTSDSDSGNPGSTPGRTFVLFWQEPLVVLKRDFASLAEQGALRSKGSSFLK